MAEHTRRSPGHPESRTFGRPDQISGSGFQNCHVTTFRAFCEVPLLFVRGIVNTICDEICNVDLIFEFLFSETARVNEKQKLQTVSIKDKGTAYYSNLT